MAWIFIYIILILIFFLTTIVLKIFGTSIFQQSKKLTIFKVIFILPFFLYYLGFISTFTFTDIYKLFNKPKQWQTVRIINDTKTTQTYIFLKKLYFDNHWQRLIDLNQKINYNIEYKIQPKQQRTFYLSVDTTESCKIAVINFNSKSDFPQKAFILNVPDLPIIFFSGEFKRQIINSVILRDAFKDYFDLFLIFTSFIGTLLFLFNIHNLFEGKLVLKLFLYFLLVINLSYSGFLTYKFIIHLIKFY